ncbi:MAG: hypothetical protein AAF441_11520 [Pseudomonadota bacterium]
MHWALIVSLVLHTAILLAGIVALPQTQEYEAADEEAIPVEIVDVGEVSKRVALAKDGEEEVEKPAAAEQEDQRTVAPTPELPQQEAKLPPLDELLDIPALTAPEPEPQPEPEPVKEAEPEPQPEPEPEPEEKKAEEKPEPPKQAAPKPRRKPKIRLAEKPKKKRKFDVDQLTALLDKSVDKPLLKKKTDETGTTRKAERDASGEETELSATEKDWLIQKLANCWTIPGGVKDAERLRVTVEYNTDGAGNVVGYPKASTSITGAVGVIAQESAVRAVLECQPFDRFETFKNHKFRVNFDPKTMLNG